MTKKQLSKLTLDQLKTLLIEKEQEQNYLYAIPDTTAKIISKTAEQIQKLKFLIEDITEEINERSKKYESSNKSKIS